MSKSFKSRVLTTLQKTGQITTVEAESRGINELRKRIYALRAEGFNIETVSYARKSDGASVAKYVLV